MASALRDAGARSVNVETERSLDSRHITDREMELWLAPGATYGRALAAGLTPAELDRVRKMFRAQLVGREVSWASAVAFLVARK